mgnify:CR=1 FL=1
MGKVGLFYGSSTGKTEFVAYQMKDQFDKRSPGLVDVFNIGSVTVEQFTGYEYIICGIPTWNTGQLQDDWAFFLPKLKGVSLKGKKIAVFGLGDQNGYGFNFLDAVGTLTDELLKCGAVLWGLWRTSGYQFEESKAQVEDHFLGLGIDEDGQNELTTARVEKWVNQVLGEFELG